MIAAADALVQLITAEKKTMMLMVIQKPPDLRDRYAFGTAAAQ